MSFNTRERFSCTNIIIIVRHHLPIFLNPIARKFLRDAWRVVVKRFPFARDAVCPLNSHIHTLISLPEGYSNYSMRIREIKRLFIKSYLAAIGPGANTTFSLTLFENFYKEIPAQHRLQRIAAPLLGNGLGLPEMRKKIMAQNDFGISNV